MNHTRTALFMSAASVLAIMSMSANSQMQMRNPLPAPRQYDLTPRGVPITEEQWINSVVDHWSGSERRSWQSLDPTFRAWASHLVWTRKNVGRLSVDPDVQRTLFQIPVGCPVAAFAALNYSVADSMSYFHDVMPEINWNAWKGIEPNFRSIAEWEMSAGHARAQQFAARKLWWQLNDDRIRSCLDAISSPMPHPNSRDAQNERREKLELEAVGRAIAPEPIKQEAREQISDAAVIDKYIVDMDRPKP